MTSSCLDLSAKMAPCFMTRDDSHFPTPVAAPHWARGHRRTKSAGNYGPRDLSIYTTMGLYAHHGTLPPLAQSESTLVLTTAGTVEFRHLVLPSGLVAPHHHHHHLAEVTYTSGGAEFSKTGELRGERLRPDLGEYHLLSRGVLRTLVFRLPWRP